MRIVFFGSGAFGLPTLEALCAEHEVGLVVTQPDRPSGRSLRPTATPIGRWAEERGLRVLKPERVNAAEVAEAVRSVGAGVNVAVAFGQKIGRGLIESPSLGAAATVNLHASLLPKYRGAAPIQHALIRGEPITGNTVFSLVERMDAGPILGTQRTPVDPLETAGELHDRLATIGPELVLRVVAELGAGEAEGIEQDESEATAAPKLSKADGWVDLAGTANEVRWRVHGLTPWPGVALRWAEGTRMAGETFWVRRVATLNYREHDREVGEASGDGMVGAGQGLLRLMEVQPPGKRVMGWDEYVRGGREPGKRDRLVSVISPPVRSVG